MSSIWRRKWQPTPLFLPGNFHWQRSLEDYSPWGRKELDMTELLNTYAQALTHVYTCETIPSVRMVDISIIPPNFLLPHSNPSLLPLPTFPFFKQLLICFLSIEISLYFIKIYINGIISMCSFWCCLPFTQQNYFEIHLCCCINSSFLLLMSHIPWYGHIPLCLSIHLLENNWVVSTSLATTCKVAINIHIQIFVWTQDFFLGHIPKHRRSGSYDIGEFDFLDMAKLISKVAGDILHLYSQGYENSSSCTSLPVLCSVPQSWPTLLQPFGP